jgi:hypothetical protein
MKKDFLYLPFIITGIAVGYFNALTGGLFGRQLFWELLFGGLLGLIVGMAFLEKQYGILVGAVIGLLVSISLDILAGSSITISDKLEDMFFGSFVGWYFPIYLKQMLVGGVVGGIVGFGWGMFHSHWIGQVCLVPGFYGGILLAISLFIIGMGVGKLFMMTFGYRLLEASKQNS